MPHEKGTARSKVAVFDATSPLLNLTPLMALYEADQNMMWSVLQVHHMDEFGAAVVDELLTFEEERQCEFLISLLISLERRVTGHWTTSPDPCQIQVPLDGLWAILALFLAGTDLCLCHMSSMASDCVFLCFGQCGSNTFKLHWTFMLALLLEQA